MRKSITSRYFTTTVIILLCSILLLGTVFMVFTARYFRDENDRALMSVVNSMLQQVHMLQQGTHPFQAAEELRDVDDRVVLQLAARQAAGVTDSTVFLADADGNVTLCSEGAACTHHALLPEKLIEEAAQKGAATQMGTLNGNYQENHYTVAKPVYTEDGVLQGFVLASASDENISGYLSDVFAAFFIACGVMLLVSSVLSIVLTSRMTTPLRRISDAAQSFGKGDFTVRVPVEGDNELANLALTFNNMAQSLETIEKSRQSFMGNIAHELRTPMTTIKGFIDGMLDGVIAPEQYPHYLAIVSEEVGRLTRLIKGMLDISKLEAGETVLNAVDYDVWETLTSALFGAEQRLEANHVGILGFAPHKTLVYADPDMVYQVFYNILDNAIKFTGDGGTITLSVTENQDMVTIGLKNTGAGISPEALPHVFERFYKEDKSRGLHASGSGLGMHISKVLVQRAGGEIWAESVAGEYAAFYFTLPSGHEKTPPPRRRREKNANIAPKEEKG
ncbi:MAG: HAMP domain-containing sensor histidine kinase [Oscillospiraceae bacterium]|nr:HAMP domain-containing sensor histidine kinase [Oscillospiraceae bacterium]